MAANFDCSDPPKKQPRAAGTYTVSTSFRCVDVDCVTTSIVQVETVSATGVTTSQWFVADAKGVPSTTVFTGDTTKKIPCEVARVKIVDACATAPSGPPVPQGPLTNQKTITGADCVGAAVSSGVIGSVETIPNALAVQKTKDCDTPLVLAGLAAIVTELQKPEFAPLVTQCRTPDGKRWAHYTIMNEQTQVFSNQYLDITTGLAQTTAPVGLDCSSDEKIDTVDLYACRNGVEIFGYALLDTISRLVVGEVWRDPATGLWGALPAGSVVGKCQQSSLVLNAVWRCEELVAKQAKAWYEPSTGALVRVNDLVTGIDVTASWVSSGFNEGQAPTFRQEVTRGYYRTDEQTCKQILLTTTYFPCGPPVFSANDLDGQPTAEFDPQFLVSTCAIGPCKVACQTNAIEATTILNSMENF